MMNARRGRVLLAALVTSVGIGCGSESLTRPSGLEPAAGSPRLRSGDDVTVAANAPPNLVFRSVPAADPRGFPYPTITGVAPLTVHFNLCRSDDPDAGDSLNWQFNFGDRRPNTDKPDFEHTCRVAHVYEQGTYTATLSVTDKHQEDQDDFSILSRRTIKVTIIADTLPPPTPPGPDAPAGASCSILEFEGGNDRGALTSRARALAYGPYMVWTTLGDVSSVQLFTYGEPSHTITGLPANGRIDVVDSCGFDYVLTVKCGNGATVVDTFQFECPS